MVVYILYRNTPQLPHSYTPSWGCYASRSLCRLSLSFDGEAKFHELIGMLRGQTDSFAGAIETVYGVSLQTLGVSGTPAESALGIAAVLFNENTLWILASILLIVDGVSVEETEAVDALKEFEKELELVDVPSIAIAESRTERLDPYDGHRPPITRSPLLLTRATTGLMRLPLPK